MSGRDVTESFSRNFLTSVAFEIRFPPLLEIERKIPTFQRELRGVFPQLRKGFPVATIGLSSSPLTSGPEGVEWAFFTKDGNSQVKTTIDRCAVVTSQYSSYKDFIKMTMNSLKSLRLMNTRA